MAYDLQRNTFKARFTMWHF